MEGTEQNVQTGEESELCIRLLRGKDGEEAKWVLANEHTKEPRKLNPPNPLAISNLDLGRLDSDSVLSFCST